MQHNSRLQLSREKRTKASEKRKLLTRIVLLVGKVFLHHIRLNLLWSSSVKLSFPSSTRFVAFAQFWTHGKVKFSWEINLTALSECNALLPLTTPLLALDMLNLCRDIKGFLWYFTDVRLGHEVSEQCQTILKFCKLEDSHQTCIWPKRSVFNQTAPF